MVTIAARHDPAEPPGLLKPELRHNIQRRRELMSTVKYATGSGRYSARITKKNDIKIMSTKKACDVIPLFPDQENDPVNAGWDPYIFSILVGRDGSYRQDRRRSPRPMTASRRRALLLATRRKK